MALNRIEAITVGPTKEKKRGQGLVQRIMDWPHNERDIVASSRILRTSINR